MIEEAVKLCRNPCKPNGEKNGCSDDQFKKLVKKSCEVDKHKSMNECVRLRKKYWRTEWLRLVYGYHNQYGYEQFKEGNLPITNYRSSGWYGEFVKANPHLSVAGLSKKITNEKFDRSWKLGSGGGNEKKVCMKDEDDGDTFYEKKQKDPRSCRKCADPYTCSFTSCISAIYIQYIYIHI